MLKFADAVKDFVSDKSNHPMGPTLQEARKVFDVIIKNVGRVGGGRPDLFARFVTTGPADTTGFGWLALKSLEADLRSAGLFLNVDVARMCIKRT